MRVAINHETIYRYQSAASYSIQYLRLTPLSGQTQRVLSWRLSAPGVITPWIDAFGNSTHVLVMDTPHDEIRITATGEVEIADGGRPLLGESEPHPPELYLRSTRLTEADTVVTSFARRFRSPANDNLGASLEGLMGGIRDAVDYRTEGSHLAGSARRALEARIGGCQDHAHLFISCARALGVPARYVSGYLCADSAGGSMPMASHAWAEAWVDGAGWLSYDVANRMSNTRAHVRVAVGLDYLDAAPVRVVGGNGGPGSMDVLVEVGDARRDRARAQQQ